MDEHQNQDPRMDSRRIALVGRIVHDPQIAVRDGVARLTFILSVTRLSKAYDGSTKKTFRFATVTLAGEQAEPCRKTISRGATCMVAGLLLGERQAFGSRIEAWLTVAADRVELVKVEAPYIHRLNGKLAPGA